MRYFYFLILILYIANFLFPTLAEIQIGYWPNPLNATPFSGVNCPNAPSSDLAALNCGSFCTGKDCGFFCPGKNCGYYCTGKDCVLACAAEGGMCCGANMYCAAGTTCVSLGYSFTCCTNGVDCPGGPDTSPYGIDLTIQSPCNPIQCANSTGYKWLCFDGFDCAAGIPMGSHFDIGGAFDTWFCVDPSLSYLYSTTQTPITTLTYCLTGSTGLILLTTTGSTAATTTTGAATPMGTGVATSITNGTATPITTSAAATTTTKSSGVGSLTVSYERLLMVVVGCLAMILHL